MNDEPTSDKNDGPAQPDHVNVVTGATYDWSALCTPLWDEIPGNPVITTPWNLNFYRSVHGARVIIYLLAKSAQLREEHRTFSNPEGRPLDDATERDLYLALLELTKTVTAFADKLWGDAMQAAEFESDESQTEK